MKRTLKFLSLALLLLVSAMPLCAGVAGSILYTTFGGTGRHIAIDIGYGYFLHSPSEGHTIELGKILDYPWDISGQSNCVDYSGDNNR